MNIKISPTDDKIYALNLIRDSMKKYLKDLAITIEEDDFSKNWVDMNNFDILIDSQRVGVLRYDKDDNFCNIRDLHIEPLFQNKGIGSIVVKKIIEEMRLEGLQAVRLKAFDSNPAIELYKRLGFVIMVEENYRVNMIFEL